MKHILEVKTISAEEPGEWVVGTAVWLVGGGSCRASEWVGGGYSCRASEWVVGTAVGLVSG